MADNVSFKQLVDFLENHAYEHLDAILRDVYPDEDMGYRPPADGAFLDANLARALEDIMHEALCDASRVPSEDDVLPVWDNMQGVFDRFIERCIGGPSEIVSDRLNDDLPEIKPLVASLASSPKLDLEGCLGSAHVENHVLQEAILAALKRIAFNFDQTVPPDVFTSYDNVVLVFFLPGQNQNNIEGMSGIWTDDVVSNAAMLETTHERRFIAVKGNLRELDNLADGDPPAIRCQGGGLTGSISGDAISAVPLETEFIIDPTIVIPCTDRALRERIASRIPSSCRAITRVFDMGEPARRNPPIEIAECTHTWE